MKLTPTGSFVLVEPLEAQVPVLLYSKYIPPYYVLPMLFQMDVQLPDSWVVVDGAMSQIPPVICSPGLCAWAIIVPDIH